MKIYEDYLETQKILTQLNKENLNVKHQGFLWLESIFTTFAGKYYGQSENFEWKKIEADFFKYAYINDVIYLLYKKYETPINGFAGEFSIYRRLNDNKYYNLQTHKQIIYPDSEFIQFKWDNNPTRWLQWYQLMIWLKESELLVENLMVADTKIIRTRYSNSDELDREEKEMITSKTNLFIDTGLDINTGELRSQFSPFKQASGQASSLAFENLQKYWTWKANFLGWTTPQEQKAERKTFAEGQIDLSNTIYLENIVINNLQLLSYEIKHRWDIDIIFNQTLDIKLNDIESGQPIQANNNDVNTQEQEHNNEI